MTLLVLLVGIFLGFLAGLLPGINITFIMIVSIPFLLGTDVFHVLLYYLALMSSSQYSGSIVALLLGIPGETTSLPVVKLREKFVNKDKIRQAIYNSATGSAIGSIIALAISIPIFYYLKDNVTYLKTSFLVAAAFIGLILCVASSENRWFVSIAMIIVGWTLSRIGFDFDTGVNFLTFDNPYLMGGLPIISVTVALFVVPSIFKMMYAKAKSTDMVAYKISHVEYYSYKNLLLPSIRGSIVGYIAGLIPYLGNGISSAIAYFTEKKVNPTNYMAQITSSETANNAAYFSVIVPLLMFGIAIVPSEMILLEILATNGQKITWALVQTMLVQLALCMIVINLICWILSYYAAGIAVKLFSLPNQIILIFVIAAVLGSVWYAGQEVTQGYYYLIVMTILTPAGILMYKQDTLPLIFAFLLQNNLEAALIRLWKLYS